MNIVTFQVIALTLLAHAAHALPPEWLHARRLDFAAAQKTSAKETGTFDQRIDHFSIEAAMPTPDDFFKQRYFIDDTFARGKDSPVLYYLCGESTCNGTPPNSLLIHQLAEELGAYRVALEHRYYGQSQPFADLSTEHLKYLSMDQALEDLASFQQYLQASRGLTGKWIAIGGSYPGELAAFYRLKHPELVAGALASSAPVLAKADFIEYDQHVAKVTSGACLDAIQTAVADVEKRLQNPESKTAVKALFQASNVEWDEDVLYILADMAAIAVQYGYQKPFCAALEQGMAQNRVTEAYAEIGTRLFKDFGMTPEQDAFQSALNENPRDYESWFGLRAWMYQSCREFGFFQTAYPEAAQSSRSARVDLGYHERTCYRLFGIKTPVDTARTNRAYYDQLFSPSTTRIFYTNGSNDPWSNLSITDRTPNVSANPAMKFFVIDGAAHCDDLGRRLSVSLDMARKQFKSLVGEWLK